MKIWQIFPPPSQLLNLKKWSKRFTFLDWNIGTSLAPNRPPCRWHHSSPGPLSWWSPHQKPSGTRRFKMVFLPRKMVVLPRNLVVLPRNLVVLPGNLMVLPRVSFPLRWRLRMFGSFIQFWLKKIYPAFGAFFWKNGNFVFSLDHHWGTALFYCSNNVPSLSCVTLMRRKNITQGRELAAFG